MLDNYSAVDGFVSIVLWNFLFTASAGCPEVASELIGMHQEGPGPNLTKTFCTVSPKPQIPLITHTASLREKQSRGLEVSQLMSTVYLCSCTCTYSVRVGWSETVFIEMKEYA